ncbi:unnamed protein product, partial [Ectocarpus sp. 12 AP-2014]
SYDDGGVDSEGSFVLLVLEGSITAEYGLEEAGKANGRAWREVGGQGARGGGDGRTPTRKVCPRHRKDRVVGKGDFLFCGKGFGDGHPVSPKVVSCKPGQTAKVLRVRAKDFAPRMAIRNMVSLKEYMFAK